MEITPPELKEMTAEQLEQRTLEIIARLPEIRRTGYWQEWGFTEETYELDCIGYIAEARYSYNGDLQDHMWPDDERVAELADEEEILLRIIGHIVKSTTA